MKEIVKKVRYVTPDGREFGEEIQAQIHVAKMTFQTWITKQLKDTLDTYKDDPEELSEHHIDYVMDAFQDIASVEKAISLLSKVYTLMKAEQKKR